MSELVVGYLHDAYPTRRNVIGVARDCRYVEVADAYKYLFRAGRKLNHWLQTQCIDEYDFGQQVSAWPRPAGTQLLHLFNQISYGTTPWISTFETTVPRLRVLLNAHHGAAPSFAPFTSNPQVQKALAVLAGPACKKLIALSACSADIEQALTREFPQWHEAICAKTIVQPPPQARLIDSPRDKEPLARRPIRLLFVGASFFRKGGVEIVETLQQLVREQHYPLHLTIVSSLLIDDYATHETPADQVRMRALLTANRDWLTHHERLDNQTVLQLMRSADVGLLPTYADTYGYVVLEFQAAGCPVITTDVRALPEINDNSKGWVIAVPKNPLGEAIYTTAADRQRISQAIRNGLKRYVEEIVANPQMIVDKGARAWQDIVDKHDPLQVGDRLRSIYLAAMNF